MRFKKMNCPYCGGVIDSDTRGRSSIFCSYCGQQIEIDDEKKEFTYNENVNRNINVNKTTHNIYTNDADVIRATSEATQDSRDFKQILVLFGLLFLIPVVILGGMFFNKVINQSQGKINAGDCGDLIGENYKTVEAHFEAAGFTNIELIDLNDSGIAFWNEGKVKMISVGGDTSFDSEDWFDPDTKVIISYH